MTDPVSDRWDDEHVIDRAGRVWLLVRDGGMATRATFTGVVSIGIAALEAEAGPLTRVTTRQISAAATPADAGSPSAGAETCAALHVADARHLPLADNSVDLILTSPPYFGLRTYGDQLGEIGGEATVAEYVNAMAEVLAECLRVLTPTGSLFMVIGDKFVSDNRGSGVDKKRGSNKHAPAGQGGFVGREVAGKGSLLGLPYRVALAAVDLGYLWRQDIVWHKPNPIPDPTAFDRCARVRETVLHLTKTRRYYAATKGGHGPDVWSFPVQGYRDPLGRRHPAVYPEALVRHVIDRWCPPDGLVLDPFVGSGTTLAVASQLGRRVVGTDTNSEYIDIARTRVEAAS